MPYSRLLTAGYMGHFTFFIGIKLKHFVIKCDFDLMSHFDLFDIPI